MIFYVFKWELHLIIQVLPQIISFTKDVYHQMLDIVDVKAYSKHPIQQTSKLIQIVCSILRTLLNWTIMASVLHFSFYNDISSSLKCHVGDWEYLKCSYSRSGKYILESCILASGNIFSFCKFSNMVKLLKCLWFLFP